MPALESPASVQLIIANNVMHNCSKIQTQPTVTCIPFLGGEIDQRVCTCPTILDKTVPGHLKASLAHLQ